MNSVIAAALIITRLLGPPGPVGAYRLTTVDGVRLPMVWHEVELHEGGLLRLSWTSGRAEVREDGSFCVVLRRRVSGPAASGAPHVDTLAGTWRQLTATRVRLRFADGRLVLWESADGFRSLALRVGRPDLDGELRVAAMVFVRAASGRDSPTQ